MVYPIYVDPFLHQISRTKRSAFFYLLHDKSSSCNSDDSTSSSSARASCPSIHKSYDLLNSLTCLVLWPRNKVLIVTGWSALPVSHKKLVVVNSSQNNKKLKMSKWSLSKQFEEAEAEERDPGVLGGKEKKKEKKEKM